MVRYTSLESLRGVAAVMVALFHSGFVYGDKYPVIAQGPIFVDFFFVLSGFVMAFAYQDKITHSLSFTTFMLLRIGRVYPLHLFMLLLWIPYIGVKYYAYHQLAMGPSDPATDNNGYTFVSNLFLLHSLGLHDDQNWNTVSWSISVEFYTYIVFFVVLSLSGRFYKPVYSLMLALLSYGLLYAVSDDSLLRTFDYGIIRCTGGFFLGMYVYSLTSETNLKCSVMVSSVLEICTVILTIILVTNTDGSKLFQFVTFVSFAAVIYVFSIQRRGIISRLLNTRPMRFVGTLSYSIYMVHMLVFTVAGILAFYIFKMPSVVVERAGADLVRYINTPYADLITLALLIVVLFLSWLTYCWIEAPWRDRFRRWAKITPTDVSRQE